jgi:hypothetical protein
MFDQCPKKYYHIKVAKDYTEDFNTQVILYGNEFHKAAEDYVSGAKAELDARFIYAKAALDKLMGMSGDKLCEYKMGLTEKFRAVGNACAEVCVIPHQASCCGMAGDRGFSYP